MYRNPPIAWQEVILEEVCQRITVGHVGPMADQYISDGIPFLRSQNVKLFRLDLSDVRFISTAFHEKLRKSAIHPDDVVIVRTGYPGTAAVVPAELTVANCADLVIVTPGPKLHPRFLAALMNSVYGQGLVSGVLVGAAQQHFNVGAARRLAFRLPPYKIQECIASILSAYDDLIENNTRRIAILEEMARALYQEWFVHFRFPGHEHVPLVDSPLGAIPEGWEVARLGDVCEKVTDGAHHSPKSIDWDDGKPMASVKDMRDWGLNLEGCRRISVEDFEKLERNHCRPKRGDILIAKDGANLNKHTFLVTEDEEVVLLSSIAIITPGQRVRPEFLCEQLKEPSVSERIKRSVSGAAIPRIILKDFMKLFLIVPPSGVQNEWEQLACPLLNLCRNLIQRNKILHTTRDLLLPKLISGEIDVSETLEEAVPEAAD